MDLSQLPGLLGLLAQDLRLFLIVVPALLLSLTFHEFAHAFAAYRLGDDTAKRLGRVTLNPAKHLDPIGTLLLLLAGFGFARPVPINPFRLGRWGTFWATAAGPLSNVLIALVCVLILKVVPRDQVIAVSEFGGGQLTLLGMVLTIILSVNVSLAVFNMIPIPPLDGSRIVGGLVPSLGRALARYEANPSSFLISMFLVFFVLQGPIRSLLRTVQNWVFSLI